MRVPQHAFFWLLAFITTIHALALPASFESISKAGKELWKRKGGGGGGGKGGGGGSSSSSGSLGGSRGSGSSSSSSGSSGSSGSRGSGTGGASLGSSSSNTGGRTQGGSGVKPSYAGGAYAGGASVPYTAGARSRGGVAPYLLGGAALGVFPGLWLYGAYAYPYGHPFTYHNDSSNRNETRNVTCLCQQYSECGCDNNTDTTYLNSVANNDTVSRVANNTLYINGTLPNGTTADGGSESASGSTSAAGSLKQQMLETSGWWIILAGVGYTMWFM